MKCSIIDCVTEAAVRGLCRKHYVQEPDIKAAATLYREEHKEEKKVLMSEWIRTPKARYGQVLRQVRIHHRALNISFEEYLIIVSNPCHYCGGTLPETGSGLDRQDSQLGYVHGNVVPCCASCNTRKGALEGAGFPYPKTVELLNELLGKIA